MRVVGVTEDITERKETEEKIRQSEERLRIATDAAEMFSWENDIAAQKMRWSDNAAKVIGCRNEDITDAIENSMFFVLPEDRPRLWERFEKILSEGINNYVVEFRGFKNRFWQAHGLIIRDGDGNPLKVIGVTQDITARKRAEEKIQTANYRFLVAEEAAKGFNYEWNLETREVTRSESIERVIGYKREELPTTWQTWADLLHPDDLMVGSENEAIKFINGLKDESFSAEYRVRHKDGHYVWVMERGLIIRGENGNVRRVIGQTMDVTEQKQTQEKLLEAERRAVSDYRKLLARIAPLAQTLGTARELQAIYRALLEFIRRETPCEGFFVSFYEEENQLKRVKYVWCEDGELDADKLEPIPLFLTEGANSRAISTGKSVITTRDLNKMSGQFQIIKEEKPLTPVESLVTPMIVMGRVIGTLEVQNHGEKYRREHIVALEMAANLAAVAIENVRLINIESEARAAAEEANRAKDEFLAVLSHELRTPLNSIKGWVSMLRNQTLDEEQKKQAIEVIARNVNSQNALIEDILDVSRIISDKMRLEIERTSLVSVLRNVIDAMRPIAEKKGIRLTAELDANADKMEGDAFRLQQIVSNLLNNAVKLTPEGGEINIFLSREADTARLTVADTGIGIAPELLPRIFDRFQQADGTSRRKYNGLGLGLAIVKHLTELHGGSVSAASEGENKGAAFTVELPLVSQSVFPFAEAGGSETQYEAVESPAMLADLKLLVVDDEPDTLEMMRFVLENCGAEVVCVNTAKQALKILTSEKFDLIISDVGMAEMDGYDLIRHIRQNLNLTAEKLPAIALSGYVSADDRERAFNAGFQKHLGKPVDVIELPHKIKALVSM